ncbi:MAG: hypothetical protein WC693_02280 [Patescibacteria group bacterium]|jgi:hypothetical protein
MKTSKQQSISIIANCDFPLSTNGKYNIELGEWRLIEHSIFNARFLTTIKISDLDVIDDKIIRKLEILLLSIFINDFIPKKISHFEISDFGNFDQDLQLRLIGIFGQKPIVLEHKTKKALDSFSSIGLNNLMIKGFHDINYVVPSKIITELYHFLLNNQNITNSLGLIQEGYRIINKLFTNQFYGFFDEFALKNAILLIVSGLEGIFVKNSSSEISFQFSTIGSIYYDRCVDEKYFEQFDNVEKIPTCDFFDVLKKLYEIRSSIAHGNSNNLLEKVRKINEIFVKNGIQQIQIVKENNLRSIILSLFIFLQPHIIGIIFGAREKLNNKEIIKEIFSK